MNDTFTDSDGDIWERGNEPGSAIWCELEYRLIAQEVKQLACGQWTRVRNAHIAGCAKNAIAALWPETTRPESTTSSGIDASAPRRIVQLTGIQHALTALCDDGSAWTIEIDGPTWLGSWTRLPPIPQGDQ